MKTTHFHTINPIFKPLVFIIGVLFSVTLILASCGSDNNSTTGFFVNGKKIIELDSGYPSPLNLVIPYDSSLTKFDDLFFKFDTETDMQPPFIIADIKLLSKYQKNGFLHFELTCKKDRLFSFFYQDTNKLYIACNSNSGSWPAGKLKVSVFGRTIEGYRNSWNIFVGDNKQPIYKKEKLNEYDIIFK